MKPVTIIQSIGPFTGKYWATYSGLLIKQLSRIVKLIDVIWCNLLAWIIYMSSCLTDWCWCWCPRLSWWMR